MLSLVGGSHLDLLETLLHCGQLLFYSAGLYLGDMEEGPGDGVLTEQVGGVVPSG